MFIHGDKDPLVTVKNAQYGMHKPTVNNNAKMIIIPEPIILFPGNIFIYKKASVDYLIAFGVVEIPLFCSYRNQKVRQVFIRRQLQFLPQAIACYFDPAHGNIHQLRDLF